MEINNEQKEHIKQALKKSVMQPPYLLIVFVLLKVFGILKWGWFATIAFPIFLPFIIVLSVLAIGGILFGIVLVGAMLIDYLQRKCRRYKFKRKK